MRKTAPNPSGSRCPERSDFGLCLKNPRGQKAPPQKDNKKPILRISEEGSVEIRRPFFLRISEEGADSRLAVRAPAI